MLLNLKTGKLYKHINPKKALETKNSNLVNHEKLIRFINIPCSINCQRISQTKEKNIGIILSHTKFENEFRGLVLNLHQIHGLIVLSSSFEFLFLN